MQHGSTQPLPVNDRHLELLGLLRRLDAFNEDFDSSGQCSLSTNGGPEFVRWILVRSLGNCYENIHRLDTAIDVLSQKIRDAQSLLCPKTGGVIMPEKDLINPFFRNRITRLFGYPSSRGLLYYIFSDTFISVEECSKVLETEHAAIRDNFYILTDTAYSRHQKIAYADYLKNFYLTVYHALTYLERFGTKLDEETKALKMLLRRASEEFTRTYYQLLLGYKVDAAAIQARNTLLDRHWKLVVEHLISDRRFESSWLKYPELDDPALILKAAASFLQEDGQVDTIIGIESGGTELCYVTSLLYQMIGLSHPTTIVVPLSRYTLRRSSLYAGETTPSAMLRTSLSQYSLAGKRVLIVDDNANTGESAQLVADAVRAESPKSLRVRVAEFDLHRSMFKHLNWEHPPQRIANPNIFARSVGITPITESSGEYLPFRQRRKIVRLRILQESFAAPEPLPVEKGAWLSVQCRNSDEAYGHEIRTLPRARQLEYRMNADYRVGKDTGLPLAELSIIKARLKVSSPSVTFLIDGNNPLTVPAICKHLIPGNYRLPICFQLPSGCSQMTASEVQAKAAALYQYGVRVRTDSTSRDGRGQAVRV